MWSVLRTIIPHYIHMTLKKRMIMYQKFLMLWKRILQTTEDDDNEFEDQVGQPDEESKDIQED